MVRMDLLHSTIKSFFRLLTLDRIIKNGIDAVLSQLGNCGFACLNAFAATKVSKYRIANDALDRQPERQGKLYYL